jgi:hypothetical protein
LFSSDCTSDLDSPFIIPESDFGTAYLFTVKGASDVSASLGKRKAFTSGRRGPTIPPLYVVFFF